MLTELETETRTIVMYEAPHRLVKTLKLLSERLGARRITVCRELTKKHETAFLTTIPEAVAYYEANDPKGECVLVIEGRSREEMRQEEQARWEEMSIEEHMEHYLAQGMNRKDAMKQTAKDRGMQKREVYNYLEKIKSKKLHPQERFRSWNNQPAECSCGCSFIILCGLLQSFHLS